MTSPTKSIEVKLELGHRAVLRARPTAEGFTHDWTVFVRGPEGCNIQHFVDKVIFILHESFPKPKRVLKEPPYQVSESGYAGFNMPVEVYFRTREDPKKVKFVYDLYLSMDGTPISNIRCEKLTFHNPPDDFCHKLLKAGGTEANRSGSSTSPAPPSILPMPGSPSRNAAPPPARSRSEGHKKPRMASDVVKSPPMEPPPPAPASPRPSTPHNPIADLFSAPVAKKEMPTEKSSKGKEQKSSQSKSKSSKSHSSSSSSNNTSGSSHKPSSSSSSKEHKSSSRDKERHKDSSREKNKEKEKSREAKPSSAGDAELKVPEQKLLEHKAEHKTEHKADHKAEHKVEHKADHKTEHKAEHRAEHKTEHKAEHKAEHKPPEPKPPEPKQLEAKVPEPKLSEAKSLSSETDSRRAEKSSQKHRDKSKDKSSKERSSKEHSSQKEVPSKVPSLPPPAPAEPSTTKPSKSSSGLRRPPSPPPPPSKKPRTQESERKKKESSKSHRPKDSPKKPTPESAERKPPPEPSERKLPPEPLERKLPPEPLERKPPEPLERKPPEPPEKLPSPLLPLPASPPLSTLPTRELSPVLSQVAPAGPPSEESNSPKVAAPVRGPLNALMLEMEQEDLLSPLSSPSASPTPTREIPTAPAPPITVAKAAASTVDHLQELRELKKRILTLEDPHRLQAVVDLVEGTGLYKVTEDSFDFDLCALDRMTLERLQACLNGR